MVISAELNSKRVKFIPPSESITCKYLNLVKLLQRVKLKVFKTSEPNQLLGIQALGIQAVQYTLHESPANKAQFNLIYPN